MTPVVGVPKNNDNDNIHNYSVSSPTLSISNFMYFRKQFNSVLIKDAIKFFLSVFPMLALYSTATQLDDHDTNPNNPTRTHDYIRLGFKGKSLNTYIIQYKALLTVCVQLISFFPAKLSHFATITTTTSTCTYDGTGAFRKNIFF